MRSLVVTCAILCASHVARAQPRGLTLAWDAPAECPGREQVLARVAALVPARDRGAQAPVAVQGRVASAGGGRLRLRLQAQQGDQRGERVLDANTCAPLADAAATFVAWLVDPSLAAAPPSVVAAPADAPVAAPGPWWSAGAEGVADAGSLPSVGAGAALRGWLAGQRWAAGARLSLWPRSTAPAAGRPGAGGHLALADVGVDACARAWAILWACAGPALSVADGHGFGVAAPRDGRAAWPSLTATALARWPAGRRWGLHGGVTGVAPLRRETFTLEGVGDLYRVGPALRVFAGAYLAPP